MSEYDMVTRNVVLEKRDEETVAALARREGFGPRGFSIALRKIIREWSMCDDGSVKGDPKDEPTRSS